MLVHQRVHHNTSDLSSFRFILNHKFQVFEKAALVTMSCPGDQKQKVFSEQTAFNTEFAKGDV